MSKSPSDASPRRSFVAVALVAVLGVAAALGVGLLMHPELPPLLADWSLRASTLTWLHTLGLDAVRPLLIGVFFVLSVALPTAAAWIAWRSDVPATAGRWVLLSAAAIALLHLASPPRWSSDAFLFAYYGKIQSVHHANPYALPGRAFARTCALPKFPHRAATPGRPCRADSHCPAPSRCLIDPFVPYQSWLEVRAAYGPAALGLFRALYVEIAPPEANVLLLRSVMALFFLLLVALTLQFRGVRAAAVLAWLPLGAEVSANGGHLEVLIGLALIGLLTAHRSRGSMVLLGLSAGLLAALKIHLGILAVPPLILLWRQRGPVQAMAATGIAAACLVLGYGLLWVSPHPFGGLSDVGDTSIRTLLDLWRRLMHSFGGKGDLQVARGVLLALWAVVTGSALWRQARSEVSVDGSAAAMLEIWLATTLFASGIYHPWYALPGLVIWLFSQSSDMPTIPVSRGVLWLATASSVVVNGMWLWRGPAAFAVPWVVLPTALLVGPALASWALWLWVASRRSAAVKQKH